MSAKWIFIIILFLIVVIFTAQNNSVVEIKFLLWYFEMSRALVIFFSMAIGIVIGFSLKYLTAKSKKKTKQQ
ncbi:DUF1049 domain-containing protein [candidate division KSB1 bacterium]|nr:DUF1049 domain-containing protein [candidate division KSB1 bacterium]